MYSKLLRVMVMASSLWFSMHGFAQQLVEISSASIAALGIETEAVRSGSEISSALATGVVVAPPGKSHSVVLPFDATMLEPLVVPGMQVIAGQDIALLQSPDYASAFAELETQRIEAEHSEYLAERTQELNLIGLRSDQELQEAEHEAEAANFNLAALEHRLSSMRQTDGAGSFVLLAPSDGLVSHVSAQSGEMVMSSEPVATIFEGEKFWARVQLPETKATNVKFGDKVLFEQSENPGQVVAVDPEIDLISRSIEILVALPEDVSWRLGQLLTATFSTQISGNALTVPTDSIQRIGNELFVFVATSEGFRTVPIEIQMQSRDFAVVVGSLRVDDLVAVSGLAALKNIVEGG